MHSRGQNTPPEELLNAGRAGMPSSGEAKYHFRVLAVLLVVSGAKAADAASLAGDARSTVTQWVKTADEEGFEAWKAVKQSGSLKS